MKRRTDLPGYIRRRKHNGNYYLIFRQGGKSVWRSLGTPSREDAERIAREEYGWVRAANENQKLAVLAAQVEGRQALIDEYEDRNALTVEDAWGAYLKAGNRRDISGSTLSVYEYYWGAFVRWLDTSYPDVKRLRDVNEGVAEAYKDTFRAKTGRTWNAHRAFLRSFWNVLATKARTTGNPWAAMARRIEDSKGRRPLTTDELKIVCGSAEGELRLALALGLYLGARLGDAVRMDWGSLDMGKRTVRYLPGKTARKQPNPLMLPMHPALYLILSETPPRKRTGPVTPKLASLYNTRGPGAVTYHIQAHFRECGLTTLKPGNGVRKLVDAGFHSLRHSAVTIMREAGAALSTSQAVVGHASREVHELYTHTDEGALRRAILALPAVAGDGADLPASETRMIDVARVRALVEQLPDSEPIKQSLLAALAE